jgi:o-succinylbenzoate---CoA ligase
MPRSGPGPSVVAVPELVALDAVGDPGFVDALQRVWDDGDAVLPVDPRLPAPARAALLDNLGATTEQRPDGTRIPYAGGRATVPGDALVVATSGTTGEPKGVVLTHDAVSAGAAATNGRLAIDPERDRWLACLPLAHLGGLGVVTRALASGTPLTMATRPDDDAIARGLADGCTRTSLVATVLRRVDTSGFTTVLLGGAAPPRDLPANVVPTYGLTESGGGVVYGHEPLDGVEVEVVDGRIRLRGPMLGRAYRLAGPDGVDEVPLTDRDGWLNTGDAGRLVAGVLVVDGRVGDMITTGGEKVWPIAVERVLSGVPGVAEVAVTGVADPEWGQSVVAVVVPADPRTPPSLDTLRAAVRAELAAPAAPRHLVLVDSLPRTALGKVVRHLLPTPGGPRQSG